MLTMIFRPIITDALVLISLLTLMSCRSGGSSPGRLSENIFATLTGEDGLSPVLDVFGVNGQQHYDIDGRDYVIGAGFQPSVLLDPEGTLHIFFQLTGSQIIFRKKKIEILKKNS